MKILISILTLIFCSISFTNVEAVKIDKNATIAVMDLGAHKGTNDSDLDLINAEKSSSEYIIQRLVTKYKLNVIDKEILRDQFQAENINTIGLIDPNTAKRIGEALNVEYLIYGNVVSVTLDTQKSVNEYVASDSTSKIVKAIIVTRIMEVATGKILMASKGIGSSISSLSNILIFIRIGSEEVPQASIHNALQKAAFQAVDIMIERLGISK